MTLLSIKLFLREEEASGEDGITIESFSRDIVLVSEDGSVFGLAVKVKGKSDKRVQTLMI
jgi:hypothetical protein